MKFRNDTRNWLTLLLTLFLSWSINDSNSRIRISTKEVKANTQQVLAVSDLTGKPLRLHIPSLVASCLPDFVYRTVWLIPESRLAGWVVYPRRNRKRSFWANAKAPTASSSTFRSLSPLLCFLTGFCFYEGFVIQKNGFRYRCSKKRVCRITFFNHQEKY